MKVVFLKNHPEKINDVSTMIYKEFVENTRSTKSYQDVYEYFSNVKEHTLPITLIAIENGICLGTISIFENDLEIRKLYTPWLASLSTKSEYRCKGVGQLLINKAIEVVKKLGYEELYLRTEEASEYYKNRGWKLLETVSDEYYEKIDVFKIELK